MLSSVNLEIPQDLATRIIPLENQLPRILELGLREFNAITQPGFKGAAEVLEFLASLPTPQEIIKLRPSKTLQDRISSLLERNRTSGLTPEENQEWEQYQYLEHLVRIAKAKALIKLKS